MIHYYLMRPASHFTLYRDRQLMYSLGGWRSPEDFHYRLWINDQHAPSLLNPTLNPVPSTFPDLTRNCEIKKEVIFQACDCRDCSEKDERHPVSSHIVSPLCTEAGFLLADSGLFYHDRVSWITVAWLWAVIGHVFVKLGLNSLTIFPPKLCIAEMPHPVSHIPS